MNIKDIRNLFFVCSVVLLFLAIFPIFNLLFPFQIEEPFSELSILGSNNIAKDYPYNVTLNNKEHLFITVNNHMGESAYYRIFLKFRNQTQSFPNDNEASSLVPLYEFRFFLLDDGEWESKVQLNIIEALQNGDIFQVKKLMINTVIVDLDSISVLDSEYEGYFFQLFFELWLYEVKYDRFNYYDGGFVGVWLNIAV